MGNGQDAVAAHGRLRPDIILMDVSMPGMNGYDATRAIRRLEAKGGPVSRIVGVTAHALDGDRLKCLEAGMDDYLSKPVSEARLRAALSGVVDPPHAAAPAVDPPHAAAPAVAAE